MKGLILLGNGFEDTEALTTIDVLLRAGEEIVRASVMDTLEVVSQYNLKVICDDLLTNIDYKSFDYLKKKYQLKMQESYVIYTKDLQYEEGILYIPIYMTMLL